MGERRESGSESRLTPISLIITSFSSAAAAVVVHAFWQPGTVPAAALTPVLMTLFAEALRRPAERLTVRSGVHGDPATIEISQPRRRWGQAASAGLVAFALGAAALTISEVLLHRATGDRHAGTTLFGSGTHGTSPPIRARGTSTPAPTPRPDNPLRTPRDARSPSERSQRPEQQPSPTPTVSPGATPPSLPPPLPSPLPSPSPSPSPSPMPAPTQVPPAPAPAPTP
jgi:hypothetical protein